MDDDKTVNDWADSFSVDESGVGVDTPETPEVPEEKSEEKSEEAKQEPQEDEPAKPEEGDEEQNASESDPEGKKSDEEQGAGDDSKEGDGTEEEAGKPEPTPASEPLTREDIKAALKEAETERTSHTNEIRYTAKEVLDSFYPQGIDRQLRDKDGDPIKSIEDVMDRVDPRTGENFTEEAAGRWLLQEQQALNRQIEELETSAYRVAETNITLKNDAHRVVDKYGDILTKRPDIAGKAKALYERTLRKDPKTGITLEAPVDLLDFYDTFLEPYIKEGGVQQPAPAPPEKPKTNPSDRADLPTTNGNSNLSKEEEEWADIAKEYQSQRN